MPLLNPLTTEQCQQECQMKEIGPALVVLEPYCPTNTDTTLCIDCSDQRNDLSFNFTREFIAITSQCSSRARQRESGKTIMLDISLGAGVARPELMAALFDTTVSTDPTDSTCQVIQLEDQPGKCPRFFQAAVIPYDGTALSFDFGIILDYVIPYTTQSSFVFSPNTPREFTFSLYAEPHPTTRSLARFLYGVDGADCEILRNAVPADCLPNATAA